MLTTKRELETVPSDEVASTCSLEMAQVLIDAGADPTLPGSMQLSALHRAKTRKRGDGPAVYQLLEDAARGKRG